MKRMALVLPLLAVLALSACAQGGPWTPMSGGRTAGTGDVHNSKASDKADKTYNSAMHK